MIGPKVNDVLKLFKYNIFFNLNFIIFLFKDILFPILDITRLAVRNKHVNSMLCVKNIVMDKLIQHVYDIENPTNQMLAFRCLSNLMQHEKGELLVVKHYEEFLKFIQNLSHENLSQKQLQVRFFF